MIVLADGQKWHLHFHHQFAATDEERKAQGRRPLSWDITTTCFAHSGPCLYTPNSPKYCAAGRAGISNCSKKDQFVRKVGAKRALTLAIDNLAKAIRGEIWKAYWLQNRRPKETPEAFKRRKQLIENQAA